jgi:hypothetical protein
MPQLLCVVTLVLRLVLVVHSEVNVKVGLGVDVGRACPITMQQVGPLAARISKLTHVDTLPRDSCHALTRHYTNSYLSHTLKMGNQPSAILDNIASGSNCACAMRKRGARVSACGAENVVLTPCSRP